MTTPQQPAPMMLDPDQMAALVKAIVDNANRLGITPKYVPATVLATPTDLTNVSVNIDGDPSDLVSPAISLMGQVSQGQRVFVIDIPAAKSYILGPYGHGAGTSTGWKALQGLSAYSVGTVGSNVSVATITGLARGRRYRIDWEVGFASLDTNTPVFTFAYDMRSPSGVDNFGGSIWYPTAPGGALDARVHWQIIDVIEDGDWTAILFNVRSVGAGAGVSGGGNILVTDVGASP